MKWLSNVGKCISFSNIDFPIEFPIIFQCFAKVFPMFFQFWNLTMFSCDFAAKFTCPGQSWINQSRSVWFRSACRVMSGIWNRPRKSVSISMIMGVTTAPLIKVLVPLLGHYFFAVVLEIGFLFCIMWDEQSTLLSNTNQQKDLIHESLVAENSYVLMLSKWNHVH